MTAVVYTGWKLSFSDQTVEIEHTHTHIHRERDDAELKINAWCPFFYRE